MLDKIKLCNYTNYWDQLFNSSGICKRHEMHECIVMQYITSNGRIEVHPNEVIAAELFFESLFCYN